MGKLIVPEFPVYIVIKNTINHQARLGKYPLLKKYFCEPSNQGRVRKIVRNARTVQFVRQQDKPTLIWFRVDTHTVMYWFSFDNSASGGEIII